MSEISLKCEVTGCSFFTPRLFPSFYGEMVEHLKVLHFPNPLLLRIFHQVHHLSCHGDSEKRCGPANPTAAASSQPREGKVKIADGEEAKKILDLNMNTKSADNIFVCPEPGCLFKTEYQSNMVRHKKNKHMKKELSGEIYEQMSLGSKRNHEEVDGSRTNKPANKLIKLHDNDGKGMEGDAGVSMRVNNFAGLMSKDDAFGRKETAAAENEGGKLKKIPGCVLCPICHLKIRLLTRISFDY